MTPALTLALLCAAPAFSHQAAAGGRPELTLAPSTATTAALLVTFGVGRKDDLGANGLTAQTQTALLYANRALPGERWDLELFSSSARVSASVGRKTASFLLVAPASEFKALSAQLLAGLFAPRLDGDAFGKLDGKAFPVGAESNTVEGLVQRLEPLLLRDAPTATGMEPQWWEFSRIQEHVAAHFVPANASVFAVGGFDAAALAGALAKYRGGTRKVPERLETSADVRQTVPWPLDLFLIGYPLPELTVEQAAAIRVYQLIFQEKLTDLLRSRGVAYSVGADLCLSPTFNGVLLTLPAHDESGIDVEPAIVSKISSLCRSGVPPEDFERLKREVLVANERVATDPVGFATAVAEGRADARWLSPEYQAAQQALTLEQLKASSSVLLDNERRRFYFKFTSAGLRGPPARARPRGGK